MSDKARGLINKSEDKILTNTTRVCDYKEINRECIRYFRGNPGFHRLFVALREKYRSLGVLGGTIRLPNLTPEEKSALTGLLRRDFHRQIHAEIKVSAVDLALNGTKFHGANLQEVLIGYWGEELISKKEEFLLYQNRRDEYFTDLAGEMSPPAAAWLLETVTQKDNAYKTLITRYEQEPKGLSKDLKAIGAALAKLPCLTGSKIQLAIFSSQITADPHFFDRATSARQLLVYALMYLFSGQKPRNAFEEAELLYKAGLFSTEIANYTVSRGLIGYVTKRKAHRGWLEFYRNGESLQVSLENLSRLKQVKSPGGIVFIVENPAVFSTLAERWGMEDGEKRRPPPRIKVLDKKVHSLPMVCANGQVNLATLTLLDMLVADGALLYYSGDFDPEGLLIADRLQKRFGESLRLWRYSVADYIKSVSGQRVTEGRLKQLQRLENESLKDLGAEIIKNGYAGYQEALIEDLWRDVKNLLPSGF